jgi:catechol 2,3-dioxygenase-like lactoylglutathione lyase family enzyme
MTEPSARLVALDHVQLAMPPGADAEARAEAFYAGPLGLERRPKPEPLASRGGCWFSNDAVTIHLGVEDDFRPARKAHPALVVDDLDALAAALEQAGHPVRWSDELPAVRRFYTDDPFGNRIELLAGERPVSRPRSRP